MNNGNDRIKIICLKFIEKKLINGLGLVWAAGHEDYGSEKIVIVPDEKYFIPEIPEIYLAIKPRGFEKPISHFEGHSVYKTKIFNLTPEETKENRIAIYESDFFVPPCFLKKNDYSVLFRITNIKNQFALIWIKNEEIRGKIFRHLRKNVPYANLQINLSDLIAVEGESGESRKGLEEKIINSINYYIKG